LAALSAEPRVALCAGHAGLEALSAIAADAPSHLEEGGWLLMEHGADQALEVAQLFERRGFKGLSLQLDLSGRPRVTRGTFHTRHEEHP
jgi:release factor glutamine methyltransferase